MDLLKQYTRQFLNTDRNNKLGPQVTYYGMADQVLGCGMTGITTYIGDGQQ